MPSPPPWRPGSPSGPGSPRAASSRMTSAESKAGESLRSLLRGNNGEEIAAAELTPLREAAERTRIRTAFSADGELELVPARSGLSGFEARLLMAVEHLQCHGAWPRLEACAEDSCQWAFYDPRARRGDRHRDARGLRRRHQEPLGRQGPSLQAEACSTSSRRSASGPSRGARAKPTRLPLRTPVPLRRGSGASSRGCRRHPSSPCAGVVAGGVVEGPLAGVLGAGLEARPGAVALKVLHGHQQAGLEAAETGAGGDELELAVGREGGPDPGALGCFAQRRQLGGGDLLAVVPPQQRAQRLPQHWIRLTSSGSRLPAGSPVRSAIQASRAAGSAIESVSSSTSRVLTNSTISSASGASAALSVGVDTSYSF